MIKYATMALAARAFMSACQPETKVYNWRVDQPTATATKKSAASSPSKVGGGGYRYEGSRDSSSGFRASE